MISRWSHLAVTALLLPSFSAQALDLMQAYEAAKNNDYELQIAESNYQSALQTLPQAQSAKLPQVNLSASRSRSVDNPSPGSDNTNNTTNLNLSLSQVIYNGVTNMNEAVAEASVAQSLAQLEQSRQALYLRVAEAYFGVLSAADNLETAYQQRKAISRQLDQARKRFEVGLIAITDVKEAEAQNDGALAQELAAENALSNARQTLLVITGPLEDDQLAELGETMALEIPAPANMNAWVEAAQQNNLSIRTSMAAQRVAMLDRDKTAEEEMPTVSLNANLGYSDVSDTSRGVFDNIDNSISIVASMPLYTGGRTNAAIKAKEASFQSAKNSLLLARRQVEQQTRTAYLGVVSGIGQVKALKQTLISSQTAQEATEAGFEVGTRTSVDVLNSLRATYAAESDYASSRYDYLLNTLRLKQAAGSISEQDLATINNLLVE